MRRLTQRTFNTNINPMTLLVGWQYGDGRVSSTAYDKESNLKALDDITPGISPPSNRTFSYDADRYFLTSSTGPYAASYGSQTLTWTYDKNGNRLTEVRSGVSGQRTFTYENDGAAHSNGVIASITPPGGSAVTVTHLTSGDLDQDEQEVKYSYDALGRVIEAFSASGCTPIARNVLTRDALNHRVRRQVYPCNSSTVSKTEYFVYGVDGALYYRETLDAGSNLTEREGYAYLEGEPVAVLRTFGAPTGNFILHNDHLGRPLAMTGTDGLIKWKGEFEPFGKSLTPRIKTSGIEPGFRFPGQWELGDSGDVQGGSTGILGTINALEDNWHRTYAQRWGRYTQPDPLGRRGDDHPYLYAAAGPLNLIDPLGEKTRVCCTPIVGAGVLTHFQHCFIHVVDEPTNLRTTYALHRVAFWKGCTFKDDAFDRAAIGPGGTAQCGPWDFKCPTDLCVEQEHNSYPEPTEYGLLGPNSNTYTAQITGKCGLVPPGITSSFSATPGWNSPPARRLSGRCPEKR